MRLHLLLLGLLCACEPRFTKSGTFAANPTSSVVLSVSDTESSALGGTSVRLGATSLTSDTVLTVSAANDFVPAAERAGPAVELTPSDVRFAVTGRVTVPYRLPTAKKLEQLTIATTASDGSLVRVSGPVEVNVTAGLITAFVEQLGLFQATTWAACTADTDCGGSFVCAGGTCTTACTPSPPVTAPSACFKMADFTGGCAATQAEQAKKACQSGDTSLTFSSCGTFAVLPVPNPLPHQWAACVYEGGALVGREIDTPTETFVGGTWSSDCALQTSPQCGGAPDAG